MLTPITPHLSLLPQLLAQIAEHVARSGGAARLQATVAPLRGDDVCARRLGSVLPYLDVSAYGIAAGVASERPPTSVGHGGMQPCAIGLHVAEWPASGQLRPPNAAYTELLERSINALEGTRPLMLGEAVPLHCAAACSVDGTSLMLRVEALVPTLSLQATPLYALGVLRSPLADSLRDAGLRRQLRTGYLTMDQSRKLVILAEGDPKAFEVPLVGVWASGVRSATDPLAWAACVRFARLRPSTAETVTAPDGSGAFLMLLYEEWSDDYGGCAGATVVSPQLYEVCPQGTYSPYKLVGSGLQMALPMPPTAESQAKCDLFTTDCAELTRLLRMLEPFPREGITSVVDATKQPVRGRHEAPADRVVEARTGAAAVHMATALMDAAPMAAAPTMAAPPLPMAAPPLPIASAAVSLDTASGDAAHSSGVEEDLQQPTPPTASTDGAAAMGAGQTAGMLGSGTAGGGTSSATEVALVAMVTQLQAQVRAMNERMEQQQATIARLTSELHQAAIERETRGAPRVTPAAAALASTVPTARPTCGRGGLSSHEALRAAVLAATEEERLAVPGTVAAEEGEGEEDEGDDAPAAPALAMDPEAAMRATQSGSMCESHITGVASHLGVDPYDEVPRIMYEPDDDDDVVALEEEDEASEGPGLTRVSLAAMDEDGEFDDDVEASDHVLSLPQ